MFMHDLIEKYHTHISNKYIYLYLFMLFVPIILCIFYFIFNIYILELLVFCFFVRKCFKQTSAI
jgi:hypothetical protein